MKKILLITMVLVFMAATAAMARRDPPPPPFPVIGTEALKKKIDSGEDLAIVDARTAEEYAHSRLPGAINVPPDKVQFIAGFLPEDKKTLLVFYCRGYG